jgi:GTPase SAR1 family protein
MYYRGAKAAILVFDITNESTFARCMSWLRDLKAHADPDIVVCIAGNKADKSISPKIDLKSCEDFAKSVHAKFVKTSALTGEGVDVLFEELVKSIIEVHRDAVVKDDSTISLAAEGRPVNSPGSCC